MNDTNKEDFIFKLGAFLNIYFITFLLVFGTVLDIFYLVVILLARRRSPRIGGKKYLLALTISSLMYLHFHFYIHTLPYWSYSVNVTSNNFISSNEYGCKLFNYMRSVSKCLFTLCTFGYSVERALAIFFPFKFMIHKNKISKSIFNTCLFTSLISPLFHFYYYEIITIDFKNTCNIDEIKWKEYAKLVFFFNLFTAVIPCGLILLLNVMILIKLTSYEIVVTTFCTKAMKTNMKNEILKMLNNIYDENFSLIQEVY